MPTRPCLQCGHLYTSGGSYCPTCQARHNQQRDQRRGNANTRGYTWGWRTKTRPIWQGQPCHYCGAPAQGADHVTPKALGGSDERANLVPACTSCNSAKRDRVDGWGRGVPPTRRRQRPT